MSTDDEGFEGHVEPNRPRDRCAGEDHHVMALELMSRTLCWALDTDTVLAKLREGA